MRHGRGRNQPRSLLLYVCYFIYIFSKTFQSCAWFHAKHIAHGYPLRKGHINAPAGPNFATSSTSCLPSLGLTPIFSTCSRRRSADTQSTWCILPVQHCVYHHLLCFDFQQRCRPIFDLSWCLNRSATRKVTPPPPPPEKYACRCICI